MRELATELFVNFRVLIIFLHVLSAIIWIGGMIAIRFAYHFSIATLEDPKIKLHTTLLNLKYFFNMIQVCIVVLFITAFIMILAMDLTGLTVALKKLIWVSMALIFVLIVVKRRLAQKYFNKQEYAKAKLQLQPIAKYFIPLNIILGLGALFLGIII